MKRVHHFLFLFFSRAFPVHNMARPNPMITRHSVTLYNSHTGAALLVISSTSVSFFVRFILEKKNRYRLLSLLKYFPFSTYVEYLTR